MTLSSYLRELFTCKIKATALNILQWNSQKSVLIFNAVHIIPKKYWSDLWIKNDLPISTHIYSCHSAPSKTVNGQEVWTAQKIHKKCQSVMPCWLSLIGKNFPIKYSSSRFMSLIIPTFYVHWGLKLCNSLPSKFLNHF